MQLNLGAAVQGPSQYFALDSVCYSGCQLTGASNCAEICQVPMSVASAPIAPASGSPQVKQIIPGLDNIWLIGGAVALVVLMVARGPWLT